MVKFSRILKDYNDAGSLSDLIALWGFINTGLPRRSQESSDAVFLTKAGLPRRRQERTDAVFLTKAGALGVGYRLNPPDSECLDTATRSTMTARVVPQIATAHANPVLQAAFEERAAFLGASAMSHFAPSTSNLPPPTSSPRGPFYTCEHYLVLLHAYPIAACTSQRALAGALRETPTGAAPAGDRPCRRRTHAAGISVRFHARRRRPPGTALT
jgi:hypothetical protein